MQLEVLEPDCSEFLCVPLEARRAAIQIPIRPVLTLPVSSHLRGPCITSHMHCQTVRRAAPLSPGVFSSAAWSTSTVHAASPTCLASYAPLKSVTPHCCTARVRTTLLLAAFSVFPIHGPIRATALHWYCRDVWRCRWPRAHHAEAGYVPSCGFGISKACFAGRLLMNTSRR